MQPKTRPEPLTYPLIATLAPINGPPPIQWTIECQTPADFKKLKDPAHLRRTEPALSPRIGCFPLPEWQCEHLKHNAECESGDCYLITYKEDNDLNEEVRGKASMEAPSGWKNALVEWYLGVKPLKEHEHMYFLGDGEGYTTPEEIQSREEAQLDEGRQPGEEGQPNEGVQPHGEE